MHATIFVKEGCRFKGFERLRTGCPLPFLSLVLTQFLQPAGPPHSHHSPQPRRGRPLRGHPLRATSSTGQATTRSSSQSQAGCTLGARPAHRERPHALGHHVRPAPRPRSLSRPAQPAVTSSGSGSGSGSRFAGCAPAAVRPAPRAPAMLAQGSRLAPPLPAATRVAWVGGRGSRGQRAQPARPTGPDWWDGAGPACAGARGPGRSLRGQRPRRGRRARVLWTRAGGTGGSAPVARWRRPC